MRKWWQNGPLQAPEGEGSGSGNDDKSKDSKDSKESKEGEGSKIKIGDREYDSKSASAALTLYEALQDPDTGIEIIENLARRAGLLDKSGDIKKEPGETKKQAESRVAAALKKKLGKDYEKFADSVGPAFDEIIEELLNEKLGNERGDRIQNSWDHAVDKFNDTYEVTDEIQNIMTELIEDAPPALNRKGFNAEKYLARMYKQAVEESGEEIKLKNIKKVKRAGKDDDETPDIVVRDMPKSLTLDDAIDAAMKGILYKRK